VLMPPDAFSQVTPIPYGAVFAPITISARIFLMVVTFVSQFEL